MVAKNNGFTPVRANLNNKYEMDGKILDSSGDILFWYDAEYHGKDYLFDKKTGKFRFQTVHVPIEKKRYFEKYNPSVYIRGNLEYVLILRGDVITKCEKIKHDVPTTYGSGDKKVGGLRDFLDVHVEQAIAKRHLKTCKLPDWLKAVKELFPLESAIANMALEEKKY